MLPDDWRKEIYDAAHKASHASNEQNSHFYKDISAKLNAVANQLTRYNDTEDRERPKKECREKWTIRALFAAAVGTGALAAFTAWQAYETHQAFAPIQQSANASDKQVTAMQGQLNEMRAQRLVTIAETSADLVHTNSAHAITNGNKLAAPGEPIIGYIFSPVWTNTGSTEARAFRTWFYLRVFDIGPTKPRHLSGKDCPAPETPDPLPDEEVIPKNDFRVELAKSLPLADLTATMGDTATKFVLMWGHMEYKDVYFPATPLHTNDWCVSVAPNDLQRETFSYIILKTAVK